MNAIVYRRFGGPEVLEPADLPRPSPGPGQILLRVLASSVNPIDWKAASGKVWPILRPRFPQVPGTDVCGEVLEVGAGVSGFPLGARVHARIRGLGGATAELAVTGADVTALVPEGMDPGEAAGLPLAGMTALQGLRDEAGMPMADAGLRVLVVGASGGVGHLAVQIAKAAGAHVTGVCSARNVALVASLGADEVVDYTAPDPYSRLAPFDIVLDCVGGPLAPWLARLGPTGRFVSCLPGPAVLLRSALNPATAQKVRPVLLNPNAADLTTLDALVATGKLRVVLDLRVPMAEAGRAWERSIAGRAAGKVVIDVAR
jgi:NADPH:quinone reductase-like Zn-dependent oxidoreductase